MLEYIKNIQTNLIDTSGIPETLQESDQWIYWRVKDRDGKARKVPVVPGTGEYASATDSKTWRPFDEELETRAPHLQPSMSLEQH